MKFRAVLLLHGKTATGFEVPAEVVDGLGGGKRPAVRVTINDFTYRSTVAPMGGRFLVGVNADIRAQSGVAAGDELAVELVLDKEPRTVEVPADLAEAIDADPALRAAWDKLAYTHRKEHVVAIEGAKKSETRTRRVEKAVEMLRTKA
jgi:hypothetical protein